MDVRLLAFGVVNADISAHTLAHKNFLHETPGKFDVFRAGQLVRQRYFYLAGELGVPCFLYFLDCVPKRGAFCVLRRRVFRQQYFRMNYTALPRVVVRQSIVHIRELLTAPVCRRTHRILALAAADYFNRTVIDCDKNSPFHFSRRMPFFPFAQQCEVMY